VLELIITKTINVRPSTTTCSVEDKFINYQENQAGFIDQPDGRLEQSYGDFAKRSDPKVEEISHQGRRRRVLQKIPPKAITNPNLKAPYNKSTIQRGQNPTTYRPNFINLEEKSQEIVAIL